jgi:hypothetical protein
MYHPGRRRDGGDDHGCKLVPSYVGSFENVEQEPNTTFPPLGSFEVVVLALGEFHSL